MTFQASYFLPPSTVGIAPVPAVRPITVGQPQGQAAPQGGANQPGFMGKVTQSFSGNNFQSLWTNGWFYVALGAAVFGTSMVLKRGSRGGTTSGTTGRRKTSRRKSTASGRRASTTGRRKSSRRKKARK